MSSILEQRIYKLKELRQKLMEGPRDRRLTIASYLQLLDYHVLLLEETHSLVNAIKNDDKKYVAEWYKDRVLEENNDKEYIYAAESENA
jgi:hypothetical protein